MAEEKKLLQMQNRERRHFAAQSDTSGIQLSDKLQAVQLLLLQFC